MRNVKVASRDEGVAIRCYHEQGQRRADCGRAQGTKLKSAGASRLCRKYSGLITRNTAGDSFQQLLYRSHRQTKKKLTENYNNNTVLKDFISKI